MAKGKRTQRSEALQQEILAYAAAHGSGAAIKKFGVNYNALSVWRKKYGAPKTTPPPAAEPKTEQKLGIVGLTPLLREVIAQQLRPALAEMLPAALDHALEERFSKKK